MNEVTQQSAMNYLATRVEQIACVRFERATYGYRPDVCRMIMDSIKKGVPIPAFNPHEHTLIVTPPCIGINFYTQDRHPDTGKIFTPLKYVQFRMLGLLERYDSKYVACHNLILSHIEEMTQMSIEEFTEGTMSFMNPPVTLKTRYGVNV